MEWIMAKATLFATKALALTAEVLPFVVGIVTISDIAYGWF